MASLVYCLLCTVYYDINFVHAQEHAQMLTAIVFCVICVHCLLLYPVYCVLITFYSLTRHIFTPGPGHIGNQQNCAHCIGNVQR